MSRARIYAKNLTANWVGYGLNLLIMFFMSPFVVHTLGDVRYGVWSLMMTMTGYLGLVEIGTRGGLGRFINYYLGKEDIAKLNGVLNTALAMFLAAGLILLAVATGLIVALPTIFPKVPDRMVPTAQWVLVLVAINVWMSFFSAAFRQILTAHERFEYTNGVDLTVMLLRTVSTLSVLSMGGGLVLLAVTHTIAGGFGVLAAYLLARRVFPKLELTPRLISRERFKELFGFSIWAFIGSLSYRLLYSADTIVIAILLGPKWVTFYAIGGMLLYKSRAILNQAVAVFRPGMLQACAREDWAGLRMDFRRASNLVMGIGILLFGGMIAFGHEFIMLWMGPKYEISYQVLLILTVSSFPAVAASACAPVYSGLNRMKLAAVLTLLQGLINLGATLMFVLILKWGVIGVAWGTFYPRIAFALVSGGLVLRWIGYDTGQFIRRNLLRWLFGGACFAGLAMVCHLLPVGHSWQGFFTRVAVATVVYCPIGYWVVFEWQDRRRILNAIQSGLHRVRRMLVSKKESLIDQ
jgi:O-antigen/teichoic acid export membrane protein